MPLPVPTGLYFTDGDRLTAGRLNSILNTINDGVPEGIDISPACVPDTNWVIMGRNNTIYPPTVRIFDVTSWPGDTSGAVTFTGGSASGNTFGTVSQVGTGPGSYGIWTALTSGLPFGWRQNGAPLPVHIHMTADASGAGLTNIRGFATAAFVIVNETANGKEGVQSPVPFIDVDAWYAQPAGLASGVVTYRDASLWNSSESTSGRKNRRWEIPASNVVILQGASGGQSLSHADYGGGSEVLQLAYTAAGRKTVKLEVWGAQSGILTSDVTHGHSIASAIVVVQWDEQFKPIAGMKLDPEVLLIDSNNRFATINMSETKWAPRRLEDNASPSGYRRWRMRIKDSWSLTEWDAKPVRASGLTYITDVFPVNNGSKNLIQHYRRWIYPGTSGTGEAEEWSPTLAFNPAKSYNMLDYDNVGSGGQGIYYLIEMQTHDTRFQTGWSEADTASGVLYVTHPPLRDMNSVISSGAVISAMPNTVVARAGVIYGFYSSAYYTEIPTQDELRRWVWRNIGWNENFHFNGPIYINNVWEPHIERSAIGHSWQVDLYETYNTPIQGAVAYKLRGFPASTAASGLVHMTVTPRLQVTTPSGNLGFLPSLSSFTRPAVAVYSVTASGTFEDISASGVGPSAV